MTSEEQQRATRTSEPGARAARESLSQLSDLLEKGEKRGIFSSRMPASVERGIQEENLKFLENRDIFSEEYYNFIQNLLSANVHSARNPNFESLCENTVLLAVNFLCNTYLHLRERQSLLVGDFVDSITSLLNRSKKATEALLVFLSSATGLQYLKPFLLEASAREVRANFAHLVFNGIRAFETHRGDTEVEEVTKVLSSLAVLVEKDAATHCKNSGQFFWLLSKFAQMVSFPVWFQVAGVHSL